MLAPQNILDFDAPSTVLRYPVCSGSDEVSRTAVIVGYGNPGHGATGEILDGDAAPTKRAGLNRIEALRADFLVYDFDSGDEAHNALAITGFESDLGFDSDEVFAANGDSGGAGFVDGVLTDSLHSKTPLTDGSQQAKPLRYKRMAWA